MNVRKNLQGFTLLELLVALSIFSIIAVMAYSGLNTVLLARIQTDQHAIQLARLQMTFTWLKRDIEQYIGRSIRDQYGDRQAALIGTIFPLTVSTLLSVEAYLDAFIKTVHPAESCISRLAPASTRH